MVNLRQQEDLELWEKWKKTHRVVHLEALLKRLQPLLFREVHKWQTTVPPAVLESQGRQLMVEALEAYDPTRGAAVATHVTTRLRKMSRAVYPHQNVVRLPENQQLLFNSFAIAQNNILDSKGREATTTELADELGWTPQRVQTFQRSFGRRELVESEGLFSGADADQVPLVDFFYHGLPPQEQTLFEDITGYGGKTPLRNVLLRKKHKLTQGQLSYQKRKLTEALRAIQQGRV